MAIHPNLNPDILRQLRDGRGLTRARLAMRAKISERQLRRIEESPNPRTSVRENTLVNLARALDVDREVLAGEASLPDWATRRESTERERGTIRAMIEPKVRLAYAMVKRRYGVTATDLITMAPLFFALLAEGSLAWRREKLEDAQEAIDRVRALASGHLVFMDDVGPAGETLEAERKSIEAVDLFLAEVFHKEVDETDLMGMGYALWENNPFSDYLRKLAADLDNPGAVHCDGDDIDGYLSGFGAGRFPDYDIWKDEVDRITSFSDKARKALEAGCVRLDDIPAELWEEGAAESRAEWLEGKLPDPGDLTLDDSDIEALPDALKGMQKARQADLDDLFPSDDALEGGAR